MIRNYLSICYATVNKSVFVRGPLRGPPVSPRDLLDLSWTVGPVGPGRSPRPEGLGVLVFHDPSI